MKQTIAISGTTGLIGGYLVEYFTDKGFKCIPITRKEFNFSDEDLASYLEGVHYIINLAGESVMQRWNDQAKNKILKSRVDTTLKLAASIKLLKKKPLKVINGSAIGIYDFKHQHDEQSTHYGNSFLTKVVKEWEKAADSISAIGVPVCKCRIGVVMSEKGGALAALLASYKRRLAVQVGNGKQEISFIHIHDLARAFRFLLLNEKLSGVFNMVTPERTTNQELLKILKSVHRNAITIRLPKFLFKFVMGEAAILLTEGERVLPKRLNEAGFEFTFPNIENTLFYLLG